MTSAPDQGAAAAPMPLASFNRWLLRALPGEQLEYHRGFLIRDRSPASGREEGERRALARIADAALQAAEDGLVELVQQRNGDFDFSYLAIKASTAIVQAAAEPLKLPRPTAHLLTNLPAPVCVPRRDRAEAGSERPVAGQHGATLAEADANLTLLEAEIADVQRRARVLRKVLDIARATGASPTTRLAEALARAGRSHGDGTTASIN